MTHWAKQRSEPNSRPLVALGYLSIALPDTSGLYVCLYSSGRGIKAYNLQIQKGFYTTLSPVPAQRSGKKQRTWLADDFLQQSHNVTSAPWLRSLESSQGHKWQYWARWALYCLWTSTIYTTWQLSNPQGLTLCAYSYKLLKISIIIIV